MRGRQSSETGSLRAGVAKSDITTDAEGVVIHDPLYAKALVLDDGTTMVAIITMDTTAIGGRRISQGMLDDVGEEFLPNLRARIKEELNIPGGHVLVNASHTHKFSVMDSYNRRNIDKYLKNINAMEKLARIQDKIATLEKHQAINQEAGEPTIRAEVQGIKIGECVLITSSAEVLVEVGLNVKTASPYEHTFIAAFSNGYMHYGPPATAYSRGGYEVTECLLAPEWQAIYEEKANEIIRRL